ncbi:MAG: rubrerythrin family protein [Candidatus Caldatribacteriaceae bacterium]
MSRVSHRMTQGNMENAYTGESQAHMRYLIFAEVAEKEGKPNIARLFRAVAYAEEVHATNHYRALGNVKDTVANLDVAIAGETFEVEEMYPAYHEVAKFQGEKESERSTHYALEAEKIHAKMYQKAKEAARKGQDLELGVVSICPVCGYTVEGDIPEFCPVCGTPKQSFKSF